MNMELNKLELKRLYIDSYKEPIVYLNSQSLVCSLEGFKAKTRVKVTLNKKSIIATINLVHSNLLSITQISLSEYAWELLDASENDLLTLSHAKPINSLSYIRRKIYGNELSISMLEEIIQDTINGKLSDVHMAAFLTACAGYKMTDDEILKLCKAMIKTGNCIKWNSDIIVDKHCIGGLPGNRTTLIVVPIIAAFGLKIPKTSSRAITSPAGTADTMEVFTNVNLTPLEMKKVVETEGGCIVWGGSVNLSPADDILIRIEKALDLDGEGQMVASILSKKVSAGSTHVVIDLPTGPTAKIRSLETANLMKKLLIKIGEKLGLCIKILISDGNQPIGYGVGPALEAVDILNILKKSKKGPEDLKKRALIIAGEILELSGKVKNGYGYKIALEILNSGRAYEKFKAICMAQGGFSKPIIASYSKDILAKKEGIIESINNSVLAKIAKLAGAPVNKSAGIYLHTKLNDNVKKGDKLFTIYSESKGELNYTVYSLQELPEIYNIR